MNVYADSPIEQLVELLGMETVKTAAWRAAQNCAQAEHQWNDCPKSMSSFEFEIFIQDELDELREAEWSAQNDI